MLVSVLVLGRCVEIWGFRAKLTEDIRALGYKWGSYTEAGTTGCDGSDRSSEGCAVSFSLFFPPSSSSSSRSSPPPRLVVPNPALATVLGVQGKGAKSPPIP